MSKSRTYNSSPRIANTGANPKHKAPSPASTILAHVTSRATSYTYPFIDDESLTGLSTLNDITQGAAEMRKQRLLRRAFVQMHHELKSEMCKPASGDLEAHVHALASTEGDRRGQLLGSGESNDCDSEHETASARSADSIAVLQSNGKPKYSNRSRQTADFGTPMGPSAESSHDCVGNITVQSLVTAAGNVLPCKRRQGDRISCWRRTASIAYC